MRKIAKKYPCFIDKTLLQKIQNNDYTIINDIAEVLVTEGYDGTNYDYDLFFDTLYWEIVEYDYGVGFNRSKNQNGHGLSPEDNQILDDLCKEIHNKFNTVTIWKNTLEDAIDYEAQAYMDELQFEYMDREDELIKNPPLANKKMKRLIRQSGKREESLLKALIDGVNKQSDGLLIADGKVDGNGVILEITVSDDNDIEEIEQFLDIDIKIDDGTTKLDMLIKNICKDYLPGAGLQQKSTNSSNKVVYHIG